MAKDDKKTEEVKAEVKKEPKPAKGESKGGKGEPKAKKEKAPAESQAPKAPKAAAPSAILAEQAPGPAYALNALLRIRSKAIADDDRRGSFFGVMAGFFGSGEAAELKEYKDLKARPYTMQERPPPNAEEEKVGAARRQKKADRKVSEEIVVEAPAAPPEQVAPPTPSTPLNLASNLATELPAKPEPATPSAAGYNDYMYQWLQMQQAAAQAAASQYQLAALSAGHTTVMLRNIPNRYSREMLVERLSNGYENEFDFVYLPIDFNSKCNVGYAFINFRSPVIAQRFYAEFHGQNCKNVLPGFSSGKIVEVTYARVQGREANLDNLKDEKFMTKLNEQPEWQPRFWDDDMNEVPFEKLLGDSTGRKRSGSRKSVDMSPVGISASSFGFGMPPYVNPWMYPQTPAANTAETPAISLEALVGKVTEENSMMLRGIPKSYSRVKFLEVVDKDFKGTYDFVFLPMDPKAEGQDNRGFAFVNFREAETGKAFTEKFNKAKSLEIFPVEGATEETECEVLPTKLQQLDQLLNRFHERAAEDTKMTPEWHPLLFDAEGNTKEFPMKSTSAVSADKKKKKDNKAEAKAAANPKSKAKAKAKAKGKQQQQPYSPYAGFGYPAYPGYPPQMNPYASYYQHMYAASAATSQAIHHLSQPNYTPGMGAMMDDFAAAVNPNPTDTLSKGKKDAVRKQIEYYFSTDNLVKDMYFRQHMDASGYVDLSVIAAFNLVKKHGASITAVAEVVSESKTLELSADSKKVRLKDQAERDRWLQKA